MNRNIDISDPKVNPEKLFDEFTNWISQKISQRCEFAIEKDSIILYVQMRHICDWLDHKEKFEYKEVEPLLNVWIEVKFVEPIDRNVSQFNMSYKLIRSFSKL